MADDVRDCNRDMYGRLFHCALQWVHSVKTLKNSKKICLEILKNASHKPSNIFFKYEFCKRKLYFALKQTSSEIIFIFVCAEKKFVAAPYQCS